MNVPRLVLWMLLAITLVGCEKDNHETPREFFNNHKIGSSPDYGVMKFGNDHVITVHGFMDDLATCQEVVIAMNFNACKETGGQGCLNPYSCTPLNH
jgi:hypothetical protein